MKIRELRDFHCEPDIIETVISKSLFMVARTCIEKAQDTEGR